MLNCENCKMEIIGAVCADIYSLPICFDCWLSSKYYSPDKTITCPKCYGLGKVTQYFKSEITDCKVCDCKGRIQQAEVFKVEMPFGRKVPKISFEECPF